MGNRPLYVYISAHLKADETRPFTSDVSLSMICMTSSVNTRGTGPPMNFRLLYFCVRKSRFSASLMSASALPLFVIGVSGVAAGAASLNQLASSSVSLDADAEVSVNQLSSSTAADAAAV